MKIVHTSSNGVDAPGAKRRYYSPELKTQVIQECRQVDASIARVALAHGINANIVHRWLHEDERAALLLRAQSFVPVTFDKAATALPMADGLLAQIAANSRQIAEREQTIATKDREILYRQTKIDQLTHEMAVLKRWKFGRSRERITASLRARLP